MEEFERVFSLAVFPLGTLIRFISFNSLYSFIFLLFLLFYSLRERKWVGVTEVKGITTWRSSLHFTNWNKCGLDNRGYSNSQRGGARNGWRGSQSIFLRDLLDLVELTGWCVCKVFLFPFKLHVFLEMCFTFISLVSWAKRNKFALLEIAIFITTDFNYFHRCLCCVWLSIS